MSFIRPSMRLHITAVCAFRSIRWPQFAWYFSTPHASPMPERLFSSEHDRPQRLRQPSPGRPLRSATAPVARRDCALLFAVKKVFCSTRSAIPGPTRDASPSPISRTAEFHHGGRGVPGGAASPMRMTNARVPLRGRVRCAAALREGGSGSAVCSRALTRDSSSSPRANPTMGDLDLEPLTDPVSDSI
jgi:hypothetical protein